MTGYHLSIGYISGATSSTSREEAFETLCDLVSEIRRSPSIIKRVFGGQNDVPWGIPHDEVADNYRVEGPALSVDRKEMEVMFCCSGSANYRKIKEECAFHACLYLICKMANLGIPVNMVIA